MSEPDSRFSHLFHLIGDPVVEIEILDETPIVQTVNRAFVDMFGYEPEEVIGQSLHKCIVPAEATDEAAQIDQQTASGEYTTGVVTRQTATGPRDFLYRGVPYERDGDEYAFGIYTDITDRNRQKQQLQREKEQLNVFASSISHDLRAPLQTAIGRAEMLPDDSEHKETLIASLDRIEELIGDGLELVRTGMEETETERVSVPDLTSNCWDILNTRGATLTVEGDFAIAGDRSRVQQLFENLFRNAIEHGGLSPSIRVGPLEEIHVTTRAKSESNYIGFYVEDDGPGIPSEKRDEIFAAGKTFDDGTGYGLAIVQKIVDAHDWTITVTESTADGARFEITGVTAVDPSAAETPLPNQTD
jgi:PAS domain S-box-containing protein